MKKVCSLILALVLVLSLVNGAVAEWKPTSALTLVICASAGGDSDVNARFFAQKMSEVVGVPVVVSNVSGGSGSIGFQTALDAGTDGNTALFYHNSLTASAAAGSCPAYVSEAFDIVSCCISDGTAGWFVSADSPYQNINDVIEAAKANPDTITFATEIGASTYAAMLMLQEAAGIQLHPVDVGTSAEKQAALLSGIVDISSFQYSVAKDYVQAGTFRCLGVLADQRAKACPDIPTFVEQGVDVSMPRYFVMGFPKGTDQEILDYWSATMASICADEQFQSDFFAATGAEVFHTEDPQTAIDTWLAQEDMFRAFSDKMK